MQDKRHTLSEVSTDLTKGAINWCLPYQTKVRGVAHHCKPSVLWGSTEAAQPEIALDEEQMALEAHPKMPAP